MCFSCYQHGLTGSVCAGGEQIGEQSLSIWDHNEKWEEENVGESITCVWGCGLPSTTYEWCYFAETKTGLS